MVAADLIGKKFKRNKYGLSTWTDEVTQVWVIMSAKIAVEGNKPIFMIRGSQHSYSADEVVFI